MFLAAMTCLGKATATAVTARMAGAYVSFMLMLDGSLGIDKNESREIDAYACDTACVLACRVGAGSFSTFRLKSCMLLEQLS